MGQMTTAIDLNGCIPAIWNKGFENRVFDTFIPMFFSNCKTVWSGRLGQSVASPHFTVPEPGQEGPGGGAGRGGIGCEGPGKGPGVSKPYVPGWAVVAPWRDSLLCPATTPRTFMFLRNFTFRPQNIQFPLTIPRLPKT